MIEVKELMTGRENIQVTAVAPKHGDLTRIAKELGKLSLEVESERLLRHQYFRPFNHFGTEDVSEDMDAPHDI